MKTYYYQGRPIYYSDETGSYTYNNISDLTYSEVRNIIMPQEIKTQRLQELFADWVKFEPEAIESVGKAKKLEVFRLRLYGAFSEYPGISALDAWVTFLGYEKDRTVKLDCLEIQLDNQ